MNLTGPNPHIRPEPAVWDPTKTQYRCIKYGQTEAVVSSRARARQWLRTTKAEIKRITKYVAY